MDAELEHSPRSWLDDFTQRFSWCCPSVWASPFLNNYFLLGVSHWMIVCIHISHFQYIVCLFSKKTYLNIMLTISFFRARQYCVYWRVSGYQSPIQKKIYTLHLQVCNFFWSVFIYIFSAQTHFCRNFGDYLVYVQFIIQ